MRAGNIMASPLKACFTSNTKASQKPKELTMVDKGSNSRIGGILEGGSGVMGGINSRGVTRRLREMIRKNWQWRKNRERF